MDNVVYLPWVTPPGQENVAQPDNRRSATKQNPDASAAEWAVPGQSPSSTTKPASQRTRTGIHAVSEAEIPGSNNDGADHIVYANSETVAARLEKSLAHLLSRSDQSRQELQQKLVRRYAQLVDSGKLDGLHPDADLTAVVEQLLDGYEQRGWLNELNAVVSAVDKAIRAGKSQGTIRQELRQRGYPANVIDEALIDYDQDAEYDALVEVASKRISQTNDLEPSVQKRRMWAFLQRRGYTSSQIQTVLTELLG